MTNTTVDACWSRKRQRRTANPSLTLPALILLLAATHSRADEIKVENDVPFSRVGDRELKMDIAYPTSKGPYPGIVIIHGGAWRFGTRKDVSGWPEYFARNGYVAAATSYRLVPEAKWPDPLVDCKTAVRFLRANAEKYHLDKNRIGVMGYSAGGHLAALLGTVGPNQGAEGKEYPNESSKVQAVVDYFGPTDLTLYGNDESAQNAVFEPMLGARYKDNPEAYKKASPLYHVAKGDPPFLLLHGTKDWLVSIEHSRLMEKKLKETGVPVEFVVIEGGSHGFSGAGAAKANDATIRFFDKCLKK